MAVRLWLEEFVERGDKALAHSFIEKEPDTLELARLIRDVLDSPSKECGERRKFLTGPRYGSNDEGERDTEAGFKLARILADPATPDDVRQGFKTA
jgi:hypothetical protein